MPQICPVHGHNCNDHAQLQRHCGDAKGDRQVRDEQQPRDVFEKPEPDLKRFQSGFGGGVAIVDLSRPGRQNLFLISKIEKWTTRRTSAPLNHPRSQLLAPGPGTADSKDSWRRGAAVYKLIASNAAASTLQESLENMARYGEVALTAAVNFTDRGSGLSCLHLAARSADRETCQLLISCRADVSSRDSHGQTALAHCIAADNYRVVFLMMSGAGMRDKDGNTPLHLATMYGRPKFYFKLGGDLAHLLTTVNARGQTHLHCALMRRPFHAETARL